MQPYQVSRFLLKILWSPPVLRPEPLPLPDFWRGGTPFPRPYLARFDPLRRVKTAEPLPCLPLRRYFMGYKVSSWPASSYPWPLGADRIRVAAHRFKPARQGKVNHVLYCPQMSSFVRPCPLLSGYVRNCPLGCSRPPLRIDTILFIFVSVNTVNRVS